MEADWLHTWNMYDFRSSVEYGKLVVGWRRGYKSNLGRRATIMRMMQERQERAIEIELYGGGVTRQYFTAQCGAILPAISVEENDRSIGQVRLGARLLRRAAIAFH